MPRGVYIRTKSLRGLKKKRIRNSVSKKKYAIQELTIHFVKLPKIQAIIERSSTIENLKDDYYLPYYQNKMTEIESQITRDEDEGFTLIITHQGFKVALRSSDEDTIIFTRQATIGLIEEMNRRGISMEFYEECTTSGGQEKYGLYK